jgi:hypothetical protein
VKCGSAGLTKAGIVGIAIGVLVGMVLIAAVMLSMSMRGSSKETHAPSVLYSDGANSDNTDEPTSSYNSAGV